MLLLGFKMVWHGKVIFRFSREILDPKTFPEAWILRQNCWVSDPKMHFIPENQILRFLTQSFSFFDCLGLFATFLSPLYLIT